MPTLAVSGQIDLDADERVGALLLSNPVRLLSHCTGSSSAPILASPEIEVSRFEGFLDGDHGASP
jgi:hypothetical protein